MSDLPYRVLARTYRPHSFDDLVGQDVLVRTLTNAFSSGRIAHAFLLTGIRGIGKTTTARIIARGLNCTGADGNGQPTTQPCGVCPNCKMILDDRHVDVIEMDAASRTGIDDIREIIDTVHYAPTSARYKIYIIDEVHMLSKSAFNALLKTLEEPPAHVKFIFATTELRKIPVTIVSRCQRFDLRRLDVDMLADHLDNICGKENVSAEKESLKLIASAAEGSVRDALSLLDQAIAMSTNADGSVNIHTEAVRDMLGLADKTRGFSLLEHAFAGNAKHAIEDLRDLHQNGADPLLVLNDLLELTHFITRIKLAASLSANVSYSDLEQQKAKTMAEKLDMSALTRAWQMLLKGVNEVKIAPQPLAAAEMILIRLAYASSLPTPDELVRQLQQSGGAVAVSAQKAPAPAATTSAPMGNLSLATAQNIVPLIEEEEEAAPTVKVESFANVVALFEQHREMILLSHLSNDVRFVSLTKGRIELRPVEPIPTDFAARIGRHLSDWTGERWLVNFSEEHGEPTLREQAQSARAERIAFATAHPSIQTIIEHFPDAEVIDVIDIEGEES